MAIIPLQKFLKDMQLVCLEDCGKSEIEIETTEISRPGLQLTGFFDYFTSNRVQVFGNAEMAYINSLSKERRSEILEKLFSYNIPCAVFSHHCQPDDTVFEAARKYGRILLKSETLVTSRVEQALINYLNNELAPSMTCHGVLMDIYGVGILLMGESGIGKSETALELVKRGHRLVADDAVTIRRIGDNRLIGEAPDILRHLMEIRGVGIINIEHMYGVSAVIASKSIDLIIQMEFWDESKEYDRFGTDNDMKELLEVKIPKLVVPVRPGRNLAIIIEVAARNLRLKNMGYSAFEELLERQKTAMYDN